MARVILLESYAHLRTSHGGLANGELQEPPGSRAHLWGGMSATVVNVGGEWYFKGSRRKGIREYGRKTKSKICSQ